MLLAYPAAFSGALCAVPHPKPPQDMLPSPKRPRWRHGLSPALDLPLICKRQVERPRHSECKVLGVYEGGYVEQRVAGWSGTAALEEPPAPATLLAAIAAATALRFSLERFGAMVLVGGERRTGEPGGGST